MVRLFRKLAEEVENFLAASLLFVFDVEPDEGSLYEGYDVTEQDLLVLFYHVVVSRVYRIHKLGNFLIILFQLFQVAIVQESEKLFDLFFGGPQFLLLVEVFLKLWIAVANLDTVVFLQRQGLLKMATLGMLVQCWSQRLLELFEKENKLTRIDIRQLKVLDHLLGEARVKHLPASIQVELLFHTIEVFSVF